MKLHPLFKLLLVAIVLCVCLGVPWLLKKSTASSKAPKQASLAPPAGTTNSAGTNTVPPTAGAGATAANLAPSPSTNEPPANATVAAVPGNPAAPGTPGGGTAPVQPGAVPAGGTNTTATAAGPAGNKSSEDIPLSFQGANIEMVAKWLAETTGKSVIKHPTVQCQLTIISPGKMPAREAINLVYRALALEGFSAIESSKSILLVREGQEPKLSPELLTSTRQEIPEGRQRLIKVFPLRHIAPADLKDKVRPVLSEKGTIDVDDRANQVIVTDYNDNLRVLADLIKELDVSSASDSVIEIYTLKHSEAEDLSALLTLILNAQSPPAGGAARPGSSSSSSSGPGGPSPGGGPPSPSGGPPGGGAGGGSAGQQVRIWSDKTANRLIVSAPRSKLPEVEKLLDILDVEKPEDLGVRVIPLKVVSAEDLVKEIGPLYQRMGGKSLKDMIEVTSSSRANSLIVLSSEANFKIIEKLVTGLDTEDAQEKVMQAFALKNADAEDVAKQLKELNQDDSQRYPYYIFYSSSGGGKSSKKLSVVADRRRNTVIVQAPPASMESIAKMIKTLDEPVTDNSLAPRIFPLKYVSAVDIEDVLNELFLKKQQQRSYWYYYDDYPQDNADRDVGRLYGKVRITSEPYSNSIIVTANSAEHLAAVEEVLKQLDVPSQAGDTTVRVNLKFAEAITVASSINILFAKGGSPPLRNAPQQAQQGDNRNLQPTSSSTQTGFELEKETKEDAYYPWIGGQPENSRSSEGRNTVRPVSDLVGRARLVPDRRSNSLLVTANVHLLPQVLKLINDLDAPTAQVLIEAKIIEVAGDLRDRLGIRWSPDGSKTFEAEDYDNSVLVNTTTAYKQVFGNALADSLHSGVLDAAVNLDFLVQFLRKQTGSKVMAEPQINIADNELGRLFVGARVPFIERSLSTDVGGLNQTFSYKDVGIILEVTPHINSTDEIAMKIRAESSNIRSGETLFGGAILDTRNFRTDLLVKSGQTIVLGGIIMREETKIVRKVPVLGDIPGLGWAFKKKDSVARDVELMVFLRPRVTRSPEQAKELLERVEKQTPKIKEWRDQVSPNTD